MKRIIVSVACLFVLIYLIIPVNQIEVRDESGTLIFCARGNEAHYISRNSIYGVAVSEVWTIDSGEIQVDRVSSAPIVLDYYGIEAYQINADGTASGTPKDLHYPQVRIKITLQGEQRLEAGNRKLEMSKNFKEGVVLIITPRKVIRLLAC